MTTLRKALAALVIPALVLLAGCTKLELDEQVHEFPRFTAWTTYGTGTATYADLAAAANAISNDTGAQIRILTSDTAVGRLGPLRKQQALMARTGDEYIFSFEGDFDFAHQDWGPQNLRMVWAPTAPHSLMTKEGLGINTPMDLRGKRVPKVSANPSVNNKIEAFLAYGGLTWDDVHPVDIAYSEQPKALQAGKIDVLYLQAYGSSLFELASAVPTKWIELDPNDTERVKAATEVAPTIEIKAFEKGAGQKPGQSDFAFVYPIPIVAYADVSDSLAYHTSKAFEDEYSAYKDATATTKDWSLDSVVTSPIVVPFHDGTVQYFKEQGVWTDDAQHQQDKLIAYGEKLREQWPEFLAQADTGADLKKQWLEWKEQHSLSSADEFAEKVGRQP